MARRIEAARATPKGQKKDFSCEMLKGYDPKYVEAATCAFPSTMSHACILPEYSCRRAATRQQGSPHFFLPSAWQKLESFFLLAP